MSATTEAIDQVERNANQAWLGDAVDALLFCAQSYQTFTSDDVWRHMSTEHVTHEPRAMGAVFRKGRQLGWITQTGLFRKTERPAAHHRPIPVWRSEIRNTGGF